MGTHLSAIPQTRNMYRVVVPVLLCVVAAIAAPTRDPGHHHDGDGIDKLLHKTIQEWINQQPTITTDQCTIKCNDVFGAIEGHHVADPKVQAMIDAVIDKTCRNTCTCDIDHVCDQDHGSSQ